MLHGDISNNRGFVIGVRCENTMFNIKNGILPFYHRLTHAEVNKEMYSLVKYLYYDTEMTVVLVIDDEHFSKKVEDYLLDFPFSQIYNVKSITEVTMMLNTGELSYFIDNDKIEIHNVNSLYAVNLSAFNSIIGRNRKVLRYET